MAAPAPRAPLTGGGARREVAAAAARLGALARACFGPAGAGRWAGAAGAGGAATNVSATLFERGADLRGPPAPPPALRLALQLLAAQERAHGDAGLLAAQLAADLVRRADEGGLAARDFRRGLEWALAKCAQDLRPDAGALRYLRRDVSLADRAALLDLVRCALASKHVCLAWGPDPDEARHVAAVLLDAFLASLSVDSRGRIASGIRLVASPGKPVLASHALRDQLLLDLPLSPAVWDRLALHARDPGDAGAGNVILFSASLVLSGQDEDVGFSLVTESEAGSPTGASWTARGAETALLRNLADKIVNVPGSKVRYVFSQKLIHPWLRMHLLDRGIVAVERLSAVHLAAVQEISGAHVFRSAAVLAAGAKALETSLLGDFGAVQVQRSSTGRRLLRVQAGSCKSRVASAVLCAPDESAADELRVLVNRAVVMLKAFVHNPFTLWGAGATEFALAANLRRAWVPAAPSAAHRVCAEILADALESVTQALQPKPVSSGGVTGFDVLDALREHHDHARGRVAGWDPFAEKPIDPRRVPDSGPSKAHALQVAAQTAIVLYGIGSIIHQDVV